MQINIDTDKIKKIAQNLGNHLAITLGLIPIVSFGGSFLVTIVLMCLHLFFVVTLLGGQGVDLATAKSIQIWLLRIFFVLLEVGYITFNVYTKKPSTTSQNND